MQKQLKFWNGRAAGIGKKGSLYIAAYTKKQAAELMNTAGGGTNLSFIHELTHYFSPMWGNFKEEVKPPTRPCVYWRETYGSKPKLLASIKS
jgi:hypothetical protein